MSCWLLKRHLLTRRRYVALKQGPYRTGYATLRVGKSRQSHENVTETAPYWGLQLLPDSSQGHQHSWLKLKKPPQAVSTPTLEVERHDAALWSLLPQTAFPIGIATR
jgi:hypothetical protein